MRSTIASRTVSEHGSVPIFDFDSSSTGLNVLKSISPRTPEGPLESVDEALSKAIRGLAGDISLLHKLSNAIRRASKDSNNAKAAKAFQIRDDEGNDAEPFLQGLFAKNIRDLFPDASEDICQRLARTMVLRRKRILYRRSRYGTASIRPLATPSQPSIERPKPKGERETEGLRQLPGQKVTAIAISDSAQSEVRTATTLHPEKFQRASSPSVVSASRTIATGNNEQHAYPPSPCSGSLRGYSKFKKQQEAELKANLEAIPGYQQHEGRPPAFLDAVATMKSKHHNKLKEEWDGCIRAIGEVVCPFCFHVMPARDAVDETKWRYAIRWVGESHSDTFIYVFQVPN